MDKAVINGKTCILVPEEVYNETPEKPERARTGYETDESAEFIYYTNTAFATQSADPDNKYLEAQYKRGNYYNDWQLAADNARADMLHSRLRQWQALNDVAVDVHNGEATKWYIFYNVEAKVLETDWTAYLVRNGEVYFSSRAKAEEALEVFRDDLIWLHTEYRRRLDEVRE